MIKTERSSRIEKLREYYLNNSPMSINKNLVCWKCHRSLMLYIEGWEKNAWSADTVRLRRSAAEAYMLENTKPIIIPGELIVGQPDFSDFSDEEKTRYDEYIKTEHIMPIKRGRADHFAPDYQLLLDVGINGMLKITEDELNKIDVCDGSCAERYEYFLCCKTELEGLLKMCDS